MQLRIRAATLSDLPAVAPLRAALWPEDAVEEHEREARAILEGRPRSTLPLVILVAEVRPGELVGFAEVGLRSHAEGCDPARPVGYLEGWFVAPDHRRRGIGRALMRAAEDWCRERGCSEMASDTELDNEASQRAHEALGFETASRGVAFRKSL